MKKLIVMAMALCSALIGCDGKDTERKVVWRTVQPRLSIPMDWRPCAQPLCSGTPVAPVCDAEITTRQRAEDAIAHQPQCIGEAIKLLRERAFDPRAKNDLAAAYYLRAKIEHRPIYLMEAWNWIEESAAAPEAAFNRGLIAEELGLPKLALASWDAASDATPWGAEAREHSGRLADELSGSSFKQWPATRRKLKDALMRGDRNAVAMLIHHYPTPAQIYLEEVVIPQWAETGAQKDLDAAVLLANEVSTVQHDPFAREVVAAITNASDRRLLRKAHRKHAEARRAQRIFGRRDSCDDFSEAVTLLTRARSPLRLTAKIESAVNCLLARKNPEVENTLKHLQRELPAETYPYTAARIRATLAFVQNDDGNHIDALANYESAAKTFEQLGDPDYVTQMQSAWSGVLLELGDKERAWNEAMATNAHAAKIAQVRGVHVRAGALSQAALKLGHPDLALLYQTDVIDAMRQELADEPPANRDVIGALEHHLSIALRSRAEITVALGPKHDEETSMDVGEAMRLASTEDQDKYPDRKDLLARIHAVDGLLLLRRDPDGAAKAFTTAIDLLPKGKVPNLYTSFLTRRAEAHRRAGRPKEAEADLQSALKVLDGEEKIQLDRRRRGEEEDIWGFFFDRFRETYRQLIELLAKEQRNEEAFRYSERAKAFEPLDLVRRLPFAPGRFRQGQPLPLSEIQAALPEDTYIFEYCVLEDRTLVWIVGRHTFELLPLPASGEDIAAWRAEIQGAVDESDESRLKRALLLPYQGLIDPPWKRIPHRPGETPRIVIVPDGEMHGLPFASLRHPVTRRYLVEDAVLSVDGSATLYVFSLLRDGQLQRGRASALLIGDPAFDKRLPEAYEMERLKGARQEVERIRTLYEPDVAVRTDEEATVRDFLQRAGASNVIHIAAHGVVNGVHPSRSPLLLAKEGDDSGKLDAQRLAGLRLPETRLVVLASCSSAGGAPVGAEGVAPLVRPFVGAGVPGIVGSLWDFSDATAERLLVSFHRHYRAQGDDAAKALREAQLEALSERKSLRAWAPFEVIGYASSPGPAPAANTKEKRPP